MKSADTLEPMKKTSLIRKVAIAEIQRWHPKAQTRGFLREIRAAFHDVAGSENLPPARRESDDLPENLAFDEPRLICAPGFQPDLHEFDRSTGEIWVRPIWKK